MEHPAMRLIDLHIEPDYVAARNRERAAWAPEIGHPQRCQTNEVHPGLGCCLACGAESGEICRAPVALTDQET
jgi:hypothetical protein